MEEPSFPTAFNLKSIAAWVAPLLEARREVTCNVAQAARLLKNVRMLYLELKDEDKDKVKDIEVTKMATLLWPLYSAHAEERKESKMLFLIRGLLIGLIPVAVLDKEKVFFNGQWTMYFFPCLSCRRSGVVWDNEKVVLMDNGKCIYFSLSVLQKKRCCVGQ